MLFQEKSVLYDRALKFLPGSYKLWNRYLLDAVKSVCIARSLPPETQFFTVFFFLNADRKFTAATSQI